MLLTNGVRPNQYPIHLAKSFLPCLVFQLRKRITTAELVSYLFGVRAYPRLGDGGSKVPALRRSGSTLYRLGSAFSQPLVAYVVVGIPTCSSLPPYLRIQSTPPVLVRSGPWSSVSGLPADKISEIDQPAGLIWLFLSIEKELAGCASHLLLGSAGRHGILV
ncbi:hypothetical protein TIFTF001_051305 [Ficus carica]|uniref:Uncharacterized protein n=1 Tax=Ficus carica TaxID=3494 RepID=A0AA87Z1M0_FICCA|nr:hypothetical protein TIFTF001_051305 [Ficus carica]